MNKKRSREDQHSNFSSVEEHGGVPRGDLVASRSRREGQREGGGGVARREGRRAGAGGGRVSRHSRGLLRAAYYERPLRSVPPF